jgi:hypothetical protein
VSGSPSPRLRQAGAAAGLAAAAALYLCFALPVSIWVGNRGEFTVGWTTLVAPFVMPAVAFVLACGLLAMLASPAAYARGRVLFATLVLLAWVQGTLLLWKYGLFDGSVIDWSVGRWRGYVDATVWIGALLAADRWRERAGRIVVRAAMVLCLAQAAMTAATLPSAGVRPPADAEAEVQARLSDFSPQGNVLHVVADGFQTDLFVDLLLEPEGKRRIAEMDGFIAFTDNLGAFPYTHLAVPALVGGRIYQNDRPVGAFLAEALGHDSILGAARDAGYEVEIGAPAGGLTPIYEMARDARVLPIPSRLHAGAWRTARDESLVLADLALFRVVPHFLKRHVYNDQEWLLQSILGRKPAGNQVLVHNAFLREMAAHMTATRERPTYKLIHLMLSHRPWVLRPDCRHAGVVQDGTRAQVRDQSRCALESLLTVVQAMKRLGIYDRTTIVISGDHGSFTPPQSLGGDAARFQQAAVWAGQARPLLLVKPAGLRGPLRVSRAPTWIIDTPATIADAAGIAGHFPGVSALRLPVDAPRERRFHIYEYVATEWGADYVNDIREFVVNGRSDDPQAWRQARTLRPPPKR